MKMAISAKQVSELRRKTGAGMMDCKKALVECDGDVAKAEEFLQKKSLAAVGKRSGRVAAEGLVGSYVHMGRIGVIVEINCETDFVARNEDFQALVKDVAMHIAAATDYVRDSEIPANVVAKQGEIFKAQLAESGAPEHMLDQIVENKLRKWKSDLLVTRRSSKTPTAVLEGRPIPLEPSKRKSKFAVSPELSWVRASRRRD